MICVGRLRYPRPVVPSDDFIAWLFATVRWAHDEVLVVDSFFERTDFVTPTREDFPVDAELEGQALAEDYFAFVQEHARTSERDWQIELVSATPASPAKILEGMAHHLTGPLEGGGFVLGPDDPLPIEYDPELVRDPEMLIAVLSRGVAHWLCAPHSEPPGGEESFHYAVDVVWVLLGFGIFASNCALRTASHERGMLIGWSMQRFGALGPLELAYCTGLFAELFEVDDREARTHLRPNARAWLADARKDLAKRHTDRIRALRSRPPAIGPYRG